MNGMVSLGGFEDDKNRGYYGLFFGSRKNIVIFTIREIVLTLTFVHIISVDYRRLFHWLHSYYVCYNQLCTLFE